MRACVLAVVFAIGCRPKFDDRASAVEGIRLLAVVAEPPEARPGEEVVLTAIFAGPSGPIAAPAVRWATCAAPRPPTESNVVSDECVRGSETVATGGVARIAMPFEACSLFGPDPPPGDFRPRDPDVTGGFYQPVLLDALGVVSVHSERVLCNLPNAPVVIATAFARDYRANRNPVVRELTGSVSFDAIPAGATITLRATWSAEDAETYVAYDSTALALVNRRESIRVSWFAAAGDLAVDRTGRDENDHATFTENGFTAPTTAGPVHLWVVARDARGGASVVHRALTVR